MINIKNTKLLFLYRTILFNKINFNTYNKELDTIVKSLNIKKRKERINYIYDETIKYINKYYYKNLCQFIDNKCISQRINNINSINGCCTYCKNLGKKGCTTSNIECKLVYCKTALKNFKKLKLESIPILKCLSIRQRLIIKMNALNKKEEVLKCLYYGIMYSTFFNLYKDITHKFTYHH